MPMQFFFVRDYRFNYRYFSSEPVQNIQIEFSRWKKIWEVAKQKLMLLPQRILAQEQAFERASKHEESKVQIFHSGHLDEKRIRTKFFFFLQKQRTKHVILLAGEILLLPISGIAAFLPGPNIFFGVLALLTITHWQALRGINSLLKREHLFTPAQSLKDWETAAESKSEETFSLALGKVSKEFNLINTKKILWK